MSKSGFKGQIFGIDLSDCSIKIAQIKKRGGKFILTNIGRQNLPLGIINQGIIEKNREVELVNFIRKATANVWGRKIKSKYTICSLPEEESFIKVIQIPKVEEREIGKMVQWQIESNFPVELNDIYFDWEVVPPFRGGKSVSKKADEILNVSVAVIPKKIVDSYLSVFKKAGLQPVAFEIESMSVIRSLFKGPFSPHPVIVVDIGRDSSGLVIFSGWTIIFTSHINISSEDFTKLISEKLNVNLDKADRFKKEIGLLNLQKIHKVSREEISSLPKQKIYHVPIVQNGEIGMLKSVTATEKIIGLKEIEDVFNALVPLLENFTEGIKQYVDYLKSFEGIEFVPDGKVGRIILCGGGANLIGLTDFLSYNLGLPVEVGNPLINISKFTCFKKGEIPKKEEMLSYTTALGLALRGANYH